MMLCRIGWRVIIKGNPALSITFGVAITRTEAE